MIFDSKIKPINIKFENDIIKEINIIIPDCYKKTKENKEKFVENEIKNIVIKNNIFENAKNFDKQDELVVNYKKLTNIIDLSKKYKLPPLYLLNIIFKNKYNKDIIHIHKNKNILDDKDYKSFNLAYNNDYYTIENKINTNLYIYKEYVKNVLYKNNIIFIENTFWFELDNFEYNNKKIKWILYTYEYEACFKKKYKNNFDDNLTFIIDKYKNDNGIIFFCNNFCSSLEISNTILINLPINENFSANDIIIKDTSKNGDFYKYGIESKTDKVTHHFYYRYYPIFLERYRNIIKNNKNINWGMIEIGIDHYRSLKLWNKYFPESYIYGIDIGFQDKGKNYEIFKCDQSKSKELNDVSNIIIKQNKSIFFIIDDGSHHPDHQIKTFNLFFDKLLAYGGCYIIEDIETSYWTKNNIYGYNTNFGYKNKNSAIEITKNLVDDINSEFLNDNNLESHDNNLNNLINPNIRNLISNIFFGQNNIIITKKTLEELEINKREYRFKNNL